MFWCCGINMFGSEGPNPFPHLLKQKLQQNKFVVALADTRQCVAKEFILFSLKLLQTVGATTAARGSVDMGPFLAVLLAMLVVTNLLAIPISFPSVYGTIVGYCARLPCLWLPGRPMQTFCPLAQYFHNLSCAA